MSKFTAALSIAIASLALTGTAAFAASDPVAQQQYTTPDAAIEALVRADRDNNRSAMLSILGPAGARLIRSGDPVADRLSRERFVAAFDEAHRIEREGAHKAVLIVGKTEWPLPIPLVDGPAGWRFDTRAGEQEILDRRIGRNELAVLEVCRAYVSAQREYLAMKVGGRSEYAQRFVSTGEQHDGLYWPAPSGDPESPLGPLVAQAQANGYRAGTEPAAAAASQPYDGYYFRILSAQGPNAPGGARNYVIEGHMTGGFALIAYPATYGDSGVMTFIVNQHGIVFERNLGSATVRIARQINSYDPDSDWHIAAP